MANKVSMNIGCGPAVYAIWFWMFLIIKVGGTAFASWSWWWVLLPIVPDIVFILNKLGWTF